ncbi:hypothetical protein [Chitinophaga rhizophila]|uniref:MG2 domain-containing protein n=1 Tax=Chitinophaga rhizophila TaxID=2866212 RepID=A0ABS7G9S5_9BACT|nr:hypothetical protein [Chitinophaga rhizophila]MBW8683885.1 hypothetical protein [Chitinophaga rhizophila]
MNYTISIFFFISLLGVATGIHAQPKQALIDSLAQRLQAYAKTGETNVYLASNKDIYIAGEDLWYNAFVLDQQTLALAEQEKILHLQLMKEGADSAVWKEMYPVTNGISAGHVYLPQTLQEGRYLLKAYTARSIFSSQPYFYAVVPIQVVQDPRSIKNNWQLGQAKASVQADQLHLEAYPEGNVLLAGVENTVAFKAVDKDHLPVSLSAQLCKNGSPIAEVKTLHGGMGLLKIVPEADASYVLRYQGRDFKIPAVVKEGVALHLLRNEKDTLLFRLRTQRTQAQQVLLRIQVRGTVQVIAAGMLKDSLLMKIPVTQLPSGIAEATLFDEQLRALAVRLVYVNHDRKLYLRFSQLKDAYAPKEQVTLKITTTDEAGKPVAAALSLKVYDRLFGNRKYTRDMLNYYQLSTQLRDTIYDPSYYFDTAHADRRDAMDMLLLTSNAQQYNLGEERLRMDKTKQPILADSLQASVMPLNKAGKKKEPISLMLFNYSKSINQVATTDNEGIFHLNTENLSIGQGFFVKYFSEKEHTINVGDPFTSISAWEKEQHPVNLLSERSIVLEEKGVDSNRLQYGNMLKEVIVQSKGRGFGDRYMGYLDSIARFEGNLDYVGQCGWLNCPACGSGTPPVEGATYSMLIEPKRSQVSGHPFSFGANDMKREVYHYPKYTEEELLKKFKMIITKGFHQHAPFYSPDYQKEDKAMTDTRNALYWNPIVVTNQQGEATISFFCSDIRSGFIGVAEGVSGNGDVGTGTFSFGVR